MSQHLFFGLQAKDFEVVCMEARQVNAALSAMHNKTDKIDGRGIAQILRTGWFSPVQKLPHGCSTIWSHAPKYQSGESDNPGRISRASDGDVPSTLYFAANAMLMRTMAASQLESWGIRLMRTKG